MDPTIFPGLIEHFPEYSVLYCHPCHHVYFPTQIQSHLFRTHQVPIQQRRLVSQHCQALAVAQSDATLALRLDLSLPVPFLPTWDGFACHQCRFYTRNRGVMRGHVNTAHQLRRAACRASYHPVKLQSWRSGSSAKYWQVLDEEEGGAAGAGAVAVAGPPTDETAARLIEEIEEQECSRLEQLAQDHLAADAEVEADETTPWLNVTEWPKQFAQRPLDLISRCGLQPAAVAAAGEDAFLGSWRGTDLVSSADDEGRLRQVTWIFGLVYERCLATLEATPYNIRCWLKSYNQDEFFPRPFSQVQKPATRQRYQRQWQRFLCFCFRAWRLPVATRLVVFGPALDLAPYEELMGRIWDLLDQADREPPRPDVRSDNTVAVVAVAAAVEEEEEEEAAEAEEDLNPWHVPSGALRDELVERICELSCAFLTTRSREADHCHYHYPLLYFVGVLGIHPYNLAYRTAYQFTPTLAGLVWVGRLLLLEHALPLVPYPTIPWAAGSTRTNPTAYFRKVHARYLCRDSVTAMSHLFRLLAFGRKIVQKEGPRANISWTLDGQALLLFSPDGQEQQGQEPKWQWRERQWQWQQPIPLAAVREMARSAIRQCHRLTDEMMFGWRPPVHLHTLVDNLANAHVGYSYLSEPRNGLQHSFKGLLRRAWDGGLQAQNQWRPRPCHRYLCQFEQLQLQLLVCSHLTSGMPSRGSEISVVKWQNTAQVIRNLFIYHDRVVLIFEYNKTRTLTNDSFYVVRVLPPSVSRLWFLYLTYIRPFVDCLRHRPEVQPTPPKSQLQAYAFVTGHNQLYTTPQLSEGIRKLSIQVCSRPLTVASYRQVVAAIAKRFVKELITTATATDDPAFQSLAYQFGHDPIALNSAYGLDQSYPAKLQPELMARYERVSACWHQWLQLADFEHELERQEAAAAAVAVAAAGAVTAPEEKPRPKKKQKVIEIADDSNSDVENTQVKRGRRLKAELPTEVRQALKVISNFYELSIDHE